MQLSLKVTSTNVDYAVKDPVDMAVTNLSNFLIPSTSD